MAESGTRIERDRGVAELGRADQTCEGDARDELGAFADGSRDEAPSHPGHRGFAQPLVARLRVCPPSSSSQQTPSPPSDFRKHVPAPCVVDSMAVTTAISPCDLDATTAAHRDVVLILGYRRGPGPRGAAGSTLKIDSCSS